MIFPSTNTDLVQRDPAIEGLGIVLDSKAFAKVLHPYLNGLRIENLRMTYIRYKPGTRCLVNYHVDTGDRTFLNMYAIAHGYGGGAAIKIHNVRNQEIVKRYKIPGRIILDDKWVVISTFPNDSKLKGLRFLDDNKEQKQLLNNLFPDRPDLWDGTFKMLNYKPERRFVAMLESKSGSRAVVRFYTDQDYHQSKKNAKALNSSTSHLRLPKKIGHSNHCRVLAFEWLDGEVLHDILVGNYDLAVQALHDTGIALAEFHMQKVDNLLPYRFETEKSANLLALANYIKCVLPNLSTRSLAVVNRLINKSCGESLASNRRNVPIHGDFHVKQILVNNDKRASFIDLDESRFDDPRVDLGLFIAHLKYMLLYGKLDEFRLPIFIEAFLRGYQQTMGEEIPRGDLNMYVAAGLFHLLPHPFRNCENEWRDRTEQILKMIELDISKSVSNELNYTHRNSVQACCSFNGLLPASPTKVPIVDHYSVSQDPSMPFLLKALDPREIESPLLDMINGQLGKNIDARLSKIQVMRYKPNRRCLVEYEIRAKGRSNNNSHDEVIITLLGKAHKKGPDFTTYNLVQDLWKSGFDAYNTGLVSIPQPIGIMPEFHMWFQTKVQGSPAIDLLIKRGKNDNSSNCNGLNLAAKIAEAIHKVHQKGKKPVVRIHTISEELKILDERLIQVAEENPRWKLKIKNVLDVCHDLASYIPNPEKTIVTGIHRDFYHDQVIVDGDRLYLTDFDNYCMGDPALDIGNFKAHLEEYALRQNDDEINRLLSIAGEAFVKRFVELSSNSKRFSVEAYTALTLARHISISSQFSNRQHLTEALISLCEKRLSSLRIQCKKAQIR